MSAAALSVNAVSRPAVNPWLVATAVVIPTFMEILDTTIATASMRYIAGGLSAPMNDRDWVMTSYLAANATILQMTGWLSARLGRRRYFLLSIAVFTAASVLCGLATSLEQLILFRVIQGLAGGGLQPASQAILIDGVPPEKQGTAMTVFGVAGLTAPVIGPTLGGWITVNYSWRWIFLINLPACALVAWGVPRLVAEAREAVPRPLDPLGVVLFTSALTALVEALLHGRASTSHMVAGLALSAAFLTAFGMQQRNRADPILDPGIFVQPAMIGIAILLCAVSVGYWAVLVYLPLFLAAAYGWSSEVAGIALLTATLPMLLLPPLGGRLADRLGWRLHFALALAILAAGNATIAIALISDGSAPALIPAFCGIAAIGVGVALAHPQLSGAAVSLVPPDLAGLASAVTVVMRQGGFAVGIAVLGAVLHNQESAISYVWPFSVATVASAAGLVAALVLLPAASKK